MDFDLTTEQQALQNDAVAFARDRLNNDVTRRDHDGEFDFEGWKRCADYGILRLPVPVDEGGAGASAVTTAAVMEGLGYGCRDLGLLFAINAHLWTVTIPLVKFGSADQKKRHLPGLCDGTIIAANGASEAEAGSDIFSLRTTAARDRDGFVLDGSKIWVTNAPIAGLFTIYATIEPARGVMGICAFLVERASTGLRTGAPFEKMGMRSAQMGEIVLERCRVPAGALLGREGFGADVFNVSMAWERASLLATCLGTMRRQLERTIAYARKRTQFGQKIGKFQSVANRIVDMQLRFETSRLLLYRAAWLIDQDRVTDADAALAKLHVSESFLQSSLDALQIHGTAGYLVENELERDVRDAVASRLYSGTSEIQRNIIARGLLKI